MTPFEYADYERLKHKIVALELEVAKWMVSAKNFKEKLDVYKHKAKLTREKRFSRKMKKKKLEVVG